MRDNPFFTLEECLQTEDKIGDMVLWRHNCRAQYAKLSDVGVKQSYIDMTIKKIDEDLADLQSILRKYQAERERQNNELQRRPKEARVNKITVNTQPIHDCIKRHNELRIFLSSAIENEAKVQAAALAKRELDTQAKNATSKFFAEFICGKRSYWNDTNKKTATLEDIINHALGKNKGFFFSNTGGDTKKALINYGVDFIVLKDKSITIEDKIRHVSEKINSLARVVERRPSR